MSTELYHVAVPALSTGLKGLALVLKKGEAFCTDRKIDPAILLQARLAPDMFHFTRQVQIATDHAKGAVCRLTGRDVLSWPDTETTFEALSERVARALALAESTAAPDFEGAAERKFSMKLGPNTMDFTGGPYLATFALPNFFFHCAAAYAILRENGVPVGKRTFMGQEH